MPLVIRVYDGGVERRGVGAKKGARRLRELQVSHEFRVDVVEASMSRWQAGCMELQVCTGLMQMCGGGHTAYK